MMSTNSSALSFIVLTIFLLLFANARGERCCGKDKSIATACKVTCSSGKRDECPAGQYCFSVKRRTPKTRQTQQPYCGTSWADAANKCLVPCAEETDCPIGETCYRDTNCNGPITGIDTCGNGIECVNGACCSQYGHCGWTEEYCNDDCISNCELEVAPPICLNPSDRAVKFGYYQSASVNSGCNPVRPSDLSKIAPEYTHLAFAFAIIDEHYRIVPKSSSHVDMYYEFTRLKLSSPFLRTVIAVGGWGFNNEPSTNKRFSEMVATQENRFNFIYSVIMFCSTYGFDGIDLDWEFPGIPDRGGSPEDRENYATLVREMRDAFSGHQLSVSMAVPVGGQNANLVYFDIVELNKHLDFFNIMSYDLHGAWSESGPIWSHTDLTEIREALNVYYKNDIAPCRLVLGFAAYGRTFTLADPDCFEPGCLYSGPGEAGECHGEGEISYIDIDRKINAGDFDENIFDSESMSMYLVSGDQWISYDNEETVEGKSIFARDEGMLGVMVWSVDQIGDAPFWPTTKSTRRRCNSRTGTSRSTRSRSIHKKNRA